MNKSKISTYRWTSRHQLRSKSRGTPGALVPEITFVLYLCGPTPDRLLTEEIAAQAVATYPKDFVTWVEGRKIPDLALIQLVLTEAAGGSWNLSLGTGKSAGV